MEQLICSKVHTCSPLNSLFSVVFFSLSYLILYPISKHTILATYYFSQSKQTGFDFILLTGYSLQLLQVCLRNRLFIFLVYSFILIKSISHYYLISNLFLSYHTIHDCFFHFSTVLTHAASPDNSVSTYPPVASLPGCSVISHMPSFPVLPYQSVYW